MEQLVDIGELLFALVLVGFLTETVVEILKTFVFKSDKSGSYLFFISLVVGLLLVFALQISIFKEDNRFAFYVGMVICGLVASRGSNYVHNWLGNIPFRNVVVKEQK